MWQETKEWISNNRVASGAAAGAAVGVGFWGVGIIPGAIVGAGVGYWSKKEKEANVKLEEMKKDPKVKNVQ